MLFTRPRAWFAGSRATDEPLTDEVDPQQIDLSWQSTRECLWSHTAALLGFACALRNQSCDFLEIVGQLSELPFACDFVGYSEGRLDKSDAKLDITWHCIDRPTLRRFCPVHQPENGAYTQMLIFVMNLSMFLGALFSCK